MRKPTSMKALEELGRVRLSEHFFMREMLYSEIANFHGIPNIPDDPDLAIAAGTRLCEELLEPLHAAFGHVSIRSAFRSVEVNTYGAERQNKHPCLASRGIFGRLVCGRTIYPQVFHRFIHKAVASVPFLEPRSFGVSSTASIG